MTIIDYGSYGTAPAPWPGTEEERGANHATHHFYTTFYGEDDCETRCTDCDCRPLGRSRTGPAAPSRLGW